MSTINASPSTNQKIKLSGDRNEKEVRGKGKRKGGRRENIETATEVWVPPLIGIERLKKLLEARRIVEWGVKEKEERAKAKMKKRKGETADQGGVSGAQEET